MIDWYSLTTKSYPLLKKLLFLYSRNDPEKAHELFVSLSKLLEATGILPQIDSYNQPESLIQISAAAGFNKNGEISPRVLKLLGFDRNVVGTITAEPWQGNPRPRSYRYVQSQTIINYLGLPNIGAKAALNNLQKFQRFLPITLNITSTPKANYSTNEKIYDLLFTWDTFKEFEPVDRVELNISCPNTGEEERRVFMGEINTLLSALKDKIHKQELYLKVSPDLEKREMDGLMELFNQKMVDGFTLCNTTTRRTSELAVVADNVSGGMSGEGVYKFSKAARTYFIENGIPSEKIIACGGISSVQKMRAEFHLGITEAQIYTPLIFQGPCLIQELKNAAKN